MTLTAADVEAIAQRTADLLLSKLSGQASDGRYLDANEAGALIGMSARYMRDHADEFGAQRVGRGPKPRLRFDRETVLAAGSSTRPHDLERTTQRTSNPSRGASRRQGVPLLQVKELEY